MQRLPTGCNVQAAAPQWNANIEMRGNQAPHCPAPWRIRGCPKICAQHAAALQFIAAGAYVACPTGCLNAETRKGHSRRAVVDHNTAVVRAARGLSAIPLRQKNPKLIAFNAYPISTSGRFSSATRRSEPESPSVRVTGERSIAAATSHCIAATAGSICAAVLFGTRNGAPRVVPTVVRDGDSLHAPAPPHPSQTLRNP